jgi:hypothetical protein
MIGINQLRWESTQPRVAQPHRLVRIRHLVAPMLLLMACSPRSALPDEPWFNPPGGTWVPDAAIASDMKEALDAKLRPFLVSRGRTTLPAVRYWFQYLGRGSGAARTIDIRGRPLPVLPRAETTNYFGPWIPEECIVHARYVLRERMVEDLEVSGVSCPARI